MSGSDKDSESYDSEEPVDEESQMNNDDANRAHI